MDHWYDETPEQMERRYLKMRRKSLSRYRRITASDPTRMFKMVEMSGVFTIKQGKISWETSLFNEWEREADFILSGPWSPENSKRLNEIIPS